VRRHWRWWRHRPLGEVIFRWVALAMSAFIVAGAVYLAFTVSKVGGVLTSLLLAVMLAVIWMEGTDVD
jgi:hypothetical protein